MTNPADQPVTRWAQLTGGSSGAEYAARFAALAATGQDLHGEASLCARLVAAPALVLDAGCGTGRVAIRLADLGYRCVGVDLDDSMLEQARTARPDLDWLLSDLATFDTALRFDLIVLAGNVIPLLEPGALADTVHNLARLLAPAGLFVTGFGLDAGHLPAGCPVTPLPEFDRAMTCAGLRLVARYPSWDGDQSAGELAGYAVSVHAAE